VAGARLEKLNPQQRRAVEHGGSVLAEAGPLLIIAGAGSGKTSTLAHRVAYLIERGADPRRIMLLTFSRRASVEMTRRVGRIMAGVAQERGSAIADATTWGTMTWDAMTWQTMTWAGTFHAIGARLLREYAETIGLAPAFTIHDREDSADLMNLVRHDLGFSKTDKRFPTKGTCLAIYSRAVNGQQPLEEVLNFYFPWCEMWQAALQSLFASYVEIKQQQHVLDYDDLLLYWAHMMQETAIAEDIAARFDHVLVDEYQDTNKLQASVLLALCPNGKGLTVVGDDAQSIYSFRAATVRNILDFPAHFTPRADVVTLEQNYRSTQPILTAANAVIELAEERFTKNLWSDRKSGERPYLVSVRDEADQARYVVEKVLESREQGLALKTQAVLFRASHHSGPLEVELTRRNIPFVKFGGLKFLEAAHIKDLLSLLRWAENPRDRVAGFRVVQLLPGAGPATATKVLDRVAERADAVAALREIKPPSAAAEHWPDFVEAVRLIRGRAAGWPAELDVARRWYEPHLQRIHDDAMLRQADLLQLSQIASTYPSRERFLTELTLDPPDATSDRAGEPLLDEDYLILSTIHSAKGQEWKSVHILNVVDGCLPSDLSTGTKAELEEERRLLYVAMTRAKDHLYLIVPQRFFVQGQRANGDRHLYASRTRFIPEALLNKFERHAWPKPVAGSAAAKPVRAPVNIGARIRRSWG
jgi:DNA helicase-2/ATP-dependent DNA helicase PcrA